MGIPIERIRTIMFVALSIDAIFFALSFKDLHRPLWRIPVLNNTWLFVGLAGSLILLAAALLLPPLRTMLSLTPLSVTDALLLLALGMVNLATIEVAKYWTRR
jgi:Ca2+-transporting ATPase